MKVNLNIKSIEDYFRIVANIVDGSFIDGEYAPDARRVVEIREFFENCISEHPLNEKFPNGLEHIDDVYEVANDEEIFEAYHNMWREKEHAFSFENAVYDANCRIDHINSSVGTIKSIANDILDKFSPILSQENMSNFSVVAKKIADGELSGKAVMDAYKPRKTRKKKTEQKIDVVK